MFRLARHKLLAASAAGGLVFAMTTPALVSTEAQRYGYVQAECPNIVKQAIETVSAQCGKTGRGKLCYGNSTITAEFQAGATNIKFQAPGDTVDVSAIKQFTLGGMDTAANSWGVAELKIKADLPDADPLQAVTMILFGSVQLSDGSNDANAAVLTQTPGANSRQNQQATATANAINQQATKSAATATTIAGLEATATAHALTPAPTGTIPAAKATQVAATATKLAVFEQTATASAKTLASGASTGLYSGLQAFYFQSSDSAPCDQAPHDGILIQSPQGIKQRVTLVIDGANISLGSTVYVTAQPGKFLTINTLEGSAVVTAAGSSATAVAGSAVKVPLDMTLRAAGVPVTTDYYTENTVRALPTGVLPSTAVALAPGFPSTIAFSAWSVTETISGGATSCAFDKGAKTLTFQPRFAYNQTTMWYIPFTQLILMTRSAPNTYSGTVYNAPSTSLFTFVVVDQNHISGTITDNIDAATVCNISFDATRNSTVGATASPSAIP